MCVCVRVCDEQQFSLTKHFPAYLQMGGEGEETGTRLNVRNRKDVTKDSEPVSRLL